LGSFIQPFAGEKWNCGRYCSWYIAAVASGAAEAADAKAIARITLINLSVVIITLVSCRIMRRHFNAASVRLGILALVFASLVAAGSRAADVNATPTSQPATRHWTVDGVDRVATLYVPESAKKEPAPLVFAFHGHGGQAAQFATRLKLHEAWPEAIVVYPQGLNTPGRLTDREGKFPGWQSAPDEQGDRDLKFFDAMLESLRKDYRVDDDRVYVTGHSNGWTFTYVLWAARGDTFAAFAPAATAMSMLIAKPEAEALDTPAKATVRPVLHIAGENDPLVKFVWQERTIKHIRQINDCEEKGEAWGQNRTLYPSKSGAPVVAWVHQNKHAMPPRAAEVIVRFFKEHPRTAVKTAGEAKKD
jgi:polyhydroxybutyrate depolymerase